MTGVQTCALPIYRETVQKYTNFDTLEKFHNELDKNALTKDQALIYDLMVSFIAHKSENEDNYTITLKSRLDFDSLIQSDSYTKV